MKVFGLEISPENIDGLPPKIWRAVMLWIYDLPVTQYLVKDLGTTPVCEIADALSVRLQESPAGIVVRTVDADDRKRAPYFWIKEANEVEGVVTTILRGGQQYFMAFAPKTAPDKAKGFVVGRYTNTRTLEFIQDAIEPRRLEEASLESVDYGLAKKIGPSFEIIKTSSGGKRLCEAVIKTILPYEENLKLLQEWVMRERVAHQCVFCIEFTYWRNTLEIHDFDYSVMWPRKEGG